MAGFDLPQGLANFGIGGPQLAPPPGVGLPPDPFALPPGLVLPPGIAAPTPEPPAPISADTTLPVLPPEVVPQAAPAPAPAPQAAPAPIFDTGNAQRDQALTDQAAATAASGDVRSRELANQATLLGERNERLAAIEEEATKQRSQDAERLKMLNERYDAAIFEDANHQVDPGRRWAQKSTGQKMLAGIGMVLSGLGQALDSARLGGPKVGSNPVVDMMVREAEQDVQLQLEEGAKKARQADRAGQAVDRFSQIAKDTATAFNLRMSSEMEKTARDIEAAAAQYGSEDAINAAAKSAAEFRERGATYKEKAVEAAFGREMEERRLAESITARKQSNALQGAGLAQSERHFQANLAEREKDRMLQIYGMEQQAAAAQAAGDRARAQELRAEAQARRDQVETDLKLAAVKVYGPDGKDLVQKDGTPFIAGDAKRAGELQQLVANTTTMTQLTDELVRLREKHEWSADLFRSPEWQQMKSVFANMALTEKDVRTLGALTGSDLTILASVLGTDDPTGMRDPTPGLRQYRKGAEEGINNKLNAAGYRGEPIRFPELTTQGVQAAAGNTPTGQLVKKAQERSTDAGRTAQFTGLDRGGVTGRDQVPQLADVFTQVPELRGLGQSAGGSRLAGQPGAAVPSADAEAAIWGLVAIAGTGDPAARTQARNALSTMTDDPNPRLAALARQIATENPSLGIEILKKTK